MTWDGAYAFVSLLCSCRSGHNHVLEVRTEGASDREGAVWFYYARPSGVRLQEEEEYFASFKEVGPGLLQLEGVKNGLPSEYQGCGLTRTLIPHIAAHHTARIRSSRHRPSEGETRSEAATKVWESMVRRKLAYYDATEDRYYYPLQAGAA